jgi:hypothetical protein
MVAPGFPSFLGQCLGKEGLNVRTLFKVNAAAVMKLQYKEQFKFHHL